MGISDSATFKYDTKRKSDTIEEIIKDTKYKDDIDRIKWMRRSRGYGIKFITKNDTSLRYDGFKDTVLCFYFLNQI